MGFWWWNDDVADVACVVCWEDVFVAVFFFAGTDEEQVCVLVARVFVEGGREGQRHIDSIARQNLSLSEVVFLSVVWQRYAVGLPADESRRFRR